MTPKIKGHIFVLLAFLVLLGMIVSPVCAASYTPTGYQGLNILDMEKVYFTNVQNLTFDKSAEDKAVMLIHFKAPLDHAVYFTLYYGTNNTVSGSASNYGNVSIWPVHTVTSVITFDGQTDQYSYFDTNPAWDYYMSGYGVNNATNATGILVYHSGYGEFDNDLAIFKEVPNLAVNLIYRVDLYSDTVFDVDISYGSKSEVAKVAGSTITDIIGEWVALLLVMGGTLQLFILMTFQWAKFLIVDNLLLTIGLWFGVTMAFSAVTTVGNGVSVKNLEKFYKTFFGYQRALFNFMVSFWHAMIGLASALISAVGAAWPIIGAIAIGAFILMAIGKLFG